MVNVAKEQKGSVLVVRLTGSIEENVNFDQLIGPPVPEMEINCKEVPRINSVGVKSWIRYFKLCNEKGSKLKFVEASTAIVEQINLISNFTCGGQVESVFVPFACGKCKAELVGLFKTADLKAMDLDTLELKCIKCGDKAEFDDVPEEYFGFLSR